jgi:Flp pilus assembly protein TadG
LTRRGAATVEFALILPIFLTLVIGIIEFGRAMMVQQILVNAARVGTRQATIPSQTDTTVSTTVSNYMSSCSVSGSTWTLTPTLASSPASGAALTGKVSVPFSSVSLLGTATWLGSKTLTATVVMNKE